MMRVLAFWVLVLPMLACNATSANVSFQVEDDYTILTVEMDEADVANAVEAIVQGGNPPFLTNPSADLRRGSVYISGEYLSPRTNERVSANVTVRMWAENNQLRAQVTSANTAAGTIPQTWIDEFNTRLAEGMARNANQGRGELTDVTITDSSLSFTVRTPRNQ